MDPRRLHALHDDELPLDERPAVEAALDADDRERVAAIDQLGEALRNTFAAETPDLDVWAAVERGIAATAAPSPAEAPPAPEQTRGAILQFEPRLRRAGRRSVWAPVLMAAAAAIALLIAPWREQPAAAATDHCEIESLEVTGALATVFEEPDATGRSTATVVWLDEEEM